MSDDASFCPTCGALLPALPSHGDVKCIACHVSIPMSEFAETEMEYTIVFNKVEAGDARKRRKKRKGGADEDDVTDPVVERKCRECGHEKMSYAALQLRSADEGQTVFFTCLKCKFKEAENS